jgi:hypothetical protein
MYGMTRRVSSIALAVDDRDGFVGAVAEGRLKAGCSQDWLPH